MFQINVLEKLFWARYKGMGRVTNKVSGAAGRAPRKMKEFLGSRGARTNKSDKCEHHLSLFMPEMVHICFSSRVGCYHMETGHQSPWKSLPWTCVEMCWVEQEIACWIWKSGGREWECCLCHRPAVYLGEGLRNSVSRFLHLQNKEVWIVPREPFQRSVLLHGLLQTWNVNWGLCVGIRSLQVTVASLSEPKRPPVVES